MGKEKYEKMVMEVVELKDDIIMASCQGHIGTICNMTVSGGGFEPTNCDESPSTSSGYIDPGYIDPITSSGYVETNPSSSGSSCGDAGTICGTVSTGGYECDD